MGSSSGRALAVAMARPTRRMTTTSVKSSPMYATSSGASLASARISSRIGIFSVCPWYTYLNLHCAARSTVAGETRPLIKPVAIPTRAIHCSAIPSWESKPLVSAILPSGPGTLYSFPFVSTPSTSINSRRILDASCVISALKQSSSSGASSKTGMGQAILPADTLSSVSRRRLESRPQRGPQPGLAAPLGLCRICSRLNVAARAGPVGVEEFAARLVHALVGVRAEVIALRLQQVRRQPRAAIAVEERQRRHERRHRDSRFRRLGHHAPPRCLASPDHFREIPIQQQVAQLRIGRKRSLDLAQERAADDAARAPHHGDFAIVEIPLVFFGRLAQHHEPLRIADDLRSQQRLPDVFHERLLVAFELELRAGQNLARRHAVFLHRAQAARVHRLADQRSEEHTSQLQS